MHTKFLLWIVIYTGTFRPSFTISTRWENVMLAFGDETGQPTGPNGNAFRKARDELYGKSSDFMWINANT